MSLGHEFNPVGPLIGADYVTEPITKTDAIIASVVFGLTLLWTGICGWQAYHQTIIARSPLRSVFVYMIWIELVCCFVMGLESWLHLMKIIPPSFAFYFTILTWWSIQVQLLLQIIINRVRVISLTRSRAKAIMIGTAVAVTMINISVFTIWVPARLQISKSYIRVNDVWDRCEKVIYLILDAVLNAYFIKSVKKNLVHNGLQKYNKLLKFNMRIILVSLLMDVMIIAAMSIPNTFVYIQFHPLAYLVKLNIEMAMAHLIKKIAVSAAKASSGRGLHDEYVENACNSSHGETKRGTVYELTTSIGKSGTVDPKHAGIQRTQEITIVTSPNPDCGGESEVLEIDSASSLSGALERGPSGYSSSVGEDEKPFVHEV